MEFESIYKEIISRIQSNYLKINDVQQLLIKNLSKIFTIEQVTEYGPHQYRTATNNTVITFLVKFKGKVKKEKGCYCSSYSYLHNINMKLNEYYESHHDNQYIYVKIDGHEIKFTIAYNADITQKGYIVPDKTGYGWTTEDTKIFSKLAIICRKTKGNLLRVILLIRTWMEKENL